MGCSNSEKWASSAWGQEGGSGGGGPRYWSAHHGGAVNNPADFLEVNGAGIGGVVNGAQGALTDKSVPFPGTAVRIAWETFLGDATTQFNIRVGTTTVETVTLTGGSGEMALVGFAVAAGETLAVEYTAGTVPSFSTFEVVVELD